MFPPARCRLSQAMTKALAVQVFTNLKVRNERHQHTGNAVDTSSQFFELLVSHNGPRVCDGFNLATQNALA